MATKATNYAALGPRMVISAGGVLIEILAERAVLLAPVTRSAAVTALRRLRLAAVLAGIGEDLAEAAEARVRTVRAGSSGFISPTFNLIPTLSAAENIEIALAPLRVGTPERRSRIGQMRHGRLATGTGPGNPMTRHCRASKPPAQEPARSALKTR